MVETGTVESIKRDRKAGAKLEELMSKYGFSSSYISDLYSGNSHPRIAPELTCRRDGRRIHENSEAQIIELLDAGRSVSAISRLTGTSRNTVTKIKSRRR